MGSSSSHPIQILIVKNHNRLLAGLVTALEIYPDLDLVGTATNGFEAIDLCQKLNPDVVLIELGLPELDGISAIQEISQHQPHIQIITLSKFLEEDLIRKAKQVGAVGHVRLGDSADSIVAIIRDVYQRAIHKHQSHISHNDNAHQGPNAKIK
jgi:two-component system nitrate/nitrite response regulator NarL